MEGNYLSNTHMMMTTTNTTTTTATAFSPLDSSGSDQCFEGNGFEFSDFFSFEELMNSDEQQLMPSMGFGQGAEFFDVGGSSNFQAEEENNRNIINTRENKNVAKERVAFRIKTDIDVLDDGYKWRKYGKKMVKNSPNPRNYYRCAMEGCPVKKRVERDSNDMKYVITTYEGYHTHETPK